MILRSTFVFLAVVVTVCVEASAEPNPYGVSGANWASNGVMTKLGLPGGAGNADGCIAYIWDTLQPTNVANMVRPRRYWEYVGANPDRIQGYDHVNDTLCYPDEFGQWVEDHPGMVWIIGNEPDMGAGQDGLTPAEYARMFHTFYDFIKVQGRDPSARFATAGLGALAYTSWLNDDIAWWNTALAEYQSQFGTDMPIDIWNGHCYAILGALDPDRVIADYYQPFLDYTRTVSGGIYADTEFWITEFGLGPQVHPDLAAEFMMQLCPRLEALGVNRFFWFLGPWTSGPSEQDVALVGPDGLPTVLGQAYASLAHSYPNPIPPVSSSQMPFPSGPVRLDSRFDADAEPWDVMSGEFEVAGGAYRQKRMSCWMGSYLPYEYRNVRVDADVRINASTDPVDWVGVTIRGGFIWTDGDTRTYLVYLRANGEIGVHTQADGTVVSVPDVVADTSVDHRLRVDMVESRIEVFVDGVSVLAWDDPNNRRSAGIVGLRTCETDSTFDNVVVRSILGGDMDHDGDIDQSDFGRFQRCLTGPGAPQSDPACMEARLDGDDDVDLNDFSVFQANVTGATPP